MSHNIKDVIEKTNRLKERMIDHRQASQSISNYLAITKQQIEKSKRTMALIDGRTSQIRIHYSKLEARLNDLLKKF